ncbi:unnamed protein product [Vitrella brassicaformis CCMP3155]|uniref:Sepiapterin reductase n=1 Tax=Vitrella brassicaformis (strain CCMP3155) TaxID=1169540 RepID=A0A0G4FM91_VITBC|nr:unnamed protein product [Vitrella brassicaformis CCMP3155]|eukprot:CEM15105.1 unnamed protein product [Vitrella brassicaformis CCMP3155]
MADERSKTLVIVTGASRGLGKAIVVEMAKALSNSAAHKRTHFLLIGRVRHRWDGAERQEAQDGIAEDAQLTVAIHRCDLAGPLEDVGSAFDAILSSEWTGSGPFHQVYFIHNSANTGPLDIIRDISPAEIRTNLLFNIGSPFLLTGRLLRFVAPNDGAAPPRAKRLRIVNISSLGAKVAFPASGLYCMGKAARDMLMLQVAAEEKGTTEYDIKTLSYAPGPMRTAMTEPMFEGRCASESVIQSFRDMEKNNTLVDPYETSRKMVRLLLDDKYESGAHIDVFDIEDEPSNEAFALQAEVMAVREENRRLRTVNPKVEVDRRAVLPSADSPPDGRRGVVHSRSLASPTAASLAGLLVRGVSQEAAAALPHPHGQPQAPQHQQPQPQPQ